MLYTLAQAEDTSTAIEVAERLGFPTAMLLLFVFIAWRVCRVLLPELKSVVKSHNKLVGELSRSGPRLEESQRAMIEGQSDLARSQKVLIDIHYSTRSSFSTVALARVASLIAQHLQDHAGAECPKLKEAIRISDQSVSDAEGRAEAYLSSEAAA